MQETAAYPKQKWIYFLLILLSFVLYGNSIQNDYCLDDNFVITDNSFVQQGFAGIDTIFKSPYARVGRATLDYRPIVSVSYAIEHQFIGNNPHVSHFINILLYALCLVLVYRIMTRIFELQKTQEWLPLIITVLFAVHPIHTEVVDSLKNRDELFGLAFGLLFIIFGFKYYTLPDHKKTNIGLAILFLALTLMSKITGVVFVAVFIFICWFKDIFKGKKWNYIFIAVCLLICIRGIYRAFHGIQRVTNTFENPLENNKDIFIALGTSLKVVLYHLKMLVYPHPLSFYYGSNVFPLNGIMNIYALLSLVIHGSLLIYGVNYFRKRDILGLFILLYFVSMAMYSNFPIPYTGMFSERALLLSSWWFISICCIVGFRLISKYAVFTEKPLYKKSMLLAMFGVFCFYAYLTITRNFLWKNNVTLMSHDIPHLKNSVLANYMYANNLRNASDHATDTAEARKLAREAINFYQNAIALAPSYPEFFFRMALAYQYNLKDTGNAEVNFKKAIALDSLYGDAHFELGKLYFERNDLRHGYQYLGNAYLIDPADSITLYYYAQSAASVGDMQTSYKVNREFIGKYPQLPVAYVNMGILYSKDRKDDSAVIYFEKAINLGYREPQLLNQLEIYFEKKQDHRKAAYYKDLLSLH